jgi:dTDP-4-dehydrorhamnose reductase
MPPSKKKAKVTRRPAAEVLKDELSSGKKQRKWMIWGAKTGGWIGNLLVDLLTAHGETVIQAESRLENRESVEKELKAHKPTNVVNCAGVTGRPNVDWCEDHRPETIRSNVIGTLNLADLCELNAIHCTIMATGCIFSYDAEHPMGGKTFTEEDGANFFGSYYSLTKGMVEVLLKAYPKHVLVLRLRMPISDDLSHRSFVTKITKYEKVVNIPNSMSVLTDLLPVGLIMSQRKLLGIYNFTNPGVISHNEILDLYTKYIDPKFKYTNFTVEEQRKVIKAERSNNELSGEKFLAALPDVDIQGIYPACEGVFERMREILKKENNLPPKRA